MDAPEGILCTKTHEYFLEKDGNFIIGITDYAAEQLGDIVFVELPNVGVHFAKGEVFATIESVKAASEVYMPVGGKVVEVNEQVGEMPEVVNEDSYEKGWFIKIEPNDVAKDSIDLLEYDDYKEDLA